MQKDFSQRINSNRETKSGNCERDEFEQQFNYYHDGRQKVYKRSLQFNFHAGLADRPFPRH